MSKVLVLENEWLHKEDLVNVLIEDFKEQGHEITIIENAVRQDRDEVIQIGECEYVIAHFGEGYLFSHKGDCVNPIHAPIAVYNNIPFDTIPSPDGDTTYVR